MLASTDKRAAVHGYSHMLKPRQSIPHVDPPPAACADSCAFIATANDSPTPQASCMVWAATGVGVSVCSACVQPYNDTLAKTYTTTQKNCTDALMSMSITVQPTGTGQLESSAEQ